VIYFVQPEGRPFVKIGYAGNVWARVDGLQTANLDELILLGIMPGELGDETLVHLLFEHTRVRGEWFHYTEEIRSFILSHAVKEQRPDSVDFRRKSQRQALPRTSPPTPAVKRVRVWVQRAGGRGNFLLQWNDPDTGQRRSRTAGTSDREKAEWLRTDLEAALNNNGHAEWRNKLSNAHPENHAETGQHLDAKAEPNGTSD
jgi:hypothetical protein